MLIVRVKKRWDRCGSASQSVICFLSVCTSAPSSSVTAEQFQLSISLALACPALPLPNQARWKSPRLTSISWPPQTRLPGLHKEPGLTYCYIHRHTQSRTNYPMQAQAYTYRTPLTDRVQSSTACHAGRRSPSEQGSMAFIFSMSDLGVGLIHLKDLRVRSCL